MRALSVKLPKELDVLLTTVARRRKASRSAVVREAIEAHVRTPRRTVLEAAGDLVGSLHGPRDLSTNPKYMDGFGE